MSKPDLSAAAALLQQLSGKTTAAAETPKPASKATRPADPKTAKVSNRPAKTINAGFTRTSNRGK